MNGPDQEILDSKEQYCRMEGLHRSSTESLVSDCRMNSFPYLISACECFLAANCKIELHDLNDNPNILY